MRETLLRLLFPPRCALCGQVLRLSEKKGFLCEACKENIPYLPEDVCPRCGGGTDTAGFCAFCLQPYAFEGAFAAFPYEKVREAVHLFKYDGGIQMGEGLGELMAAYLLKYHGELLAKIDVMLAVPLHRAKEKRRGFNQTHILCEKISERTGLPFWKAGLERKRDTIAQSTLSPEERKENLKDAFRATADFSGKRILLVDDVFTTGATCHACAKELYRSGAAAVVVFSLAAAGSHGEKEGPVSTAEA